MTSYGVQEFEITKLQLGLLFHEIPISSLSFEVASNDNRLPFENSHCVTIT